MRAEVAFWAAVALVAVAAVAAFQIVAKSPTASKVPGVTGLSAVIAGDA